MRKKIDTMVVGTAIKYEINNTTVRAVACNFRF